MEPDARDEVRDEARAPHEPSDGQDKPSVPSGRFAETRDGSVAAPLSSRPEPTTTYLAGDVIDGKYRLSKVLGEGGMGAVWLAKNLTLDIDVAVKLIRREFATAEASQRLLQEARAAARIGHPSIVRVFDFGTTAQKDPFIVMEVLHGESLAQTISRRRRLSALAAVRTLLPVASALAAAHAKGIVHRDLKPDNVLLVTDDRGVVVPKVVDFGIAKLHHEEVVRTTTQAGVILGSPHYMSPEQACGRSDVDHRTDIWAFCVLLYEVVAGVRPFDGGNYNALLSAILIHDPPPWSEYEVVEAELWEIVQRGLTKEASDRWQTMRELGAALAAWAQSRGVETDAAGNSLKAHWLEPEDHRPLSDTPPASSAALSQPRPRMMSERELAPPPLPTNLGGEDEEQAQEPGAASMHLAPPTSEQLATSRSRPPIERRRSPALWIGPLALAIGALGTAGWVLATRGPAGEATNARAASSVQTSPPTETKSVPTTNGASNGRAAGAPDTNEALANPAASAVGSSAPLASASADSLKTPHTNTSTSKSKQKGTMPVPTDPNF